jgi:hypothetical protein
LPKSEDGSDTAGNLSWLSMPILRSDVLTLRLPTDWGPSAMASAARAVGKSMRCRSKSALVADLVEDPLSGYRAGHQQCTSVFVALK